MTKQKFLDSLQWNVFDGTFKALIEHLSLEGLRPFVLQFADSKPDSFEFVGDFNYQCGVCPCCNEGRSQVARYAFLWKER